MLNYAIQACPPPLWAGAMHTSGLFGYLIKELISDKVTMLGFDFILYLIRLLSDQASARYACRDCVTILAHDSVRCNRVHSAYASYGRTRVGPPRESLIRRPAGPILEQST